MARLPRLCVPGHAHHLIQHGNNRQPICLTDADYATLSRMVREAAQKYAVALHAWTLLPQQIHIVATPAGAQDLSRLMQQIGRSYVRYFNQTHVRTGTLWEGRYRSTVIDPQQLLAVMVGMDTLPVHAALAAQAHDYPWSSAAHYSGHRYERGITPPAPVWQLGNTPYAREAAYQQLLQDSYLTARWPVLEAAALQGWVHGSDSFIHAIEQQTQRRVHKRKPGRPRTQSPQDNTQAPPAASEPDRP